MKDLRQIGILGGTLGGGIFFRRDVKTLCIKNSEYKSETKKMIPIVISTISHFWSPTLTTFW